MDKYEKLDSWLEMMQHQLEKIQEVHNESILNGILMDNDIEI